MTMDKKVIRGISADIFIREEVYAPLICTQF